MKNLTQEQMVELLQNFADWLNLEYNGIDVPIEVIKEYLDQDN
jgi:hypothetical protein